MNKRIGLSSITAVTIVFLAFSSLTMGVLLTATVVGGIGGSVEPNEITLDPNATVVLVATPDSGYRVKEWTGIDDPNETGNNATVTIADANVVVTVEFEAIPQHQLDIIVIGDGDVTPASGPQEEDATITLTADPNTGQRVKSWSGADDDTSTANTNAVTMADSNAVVTVTFEVIPEQYQLTVVVEGQGAVDPLSGPQDANAVVSLSASPIEGWELIEWIGTDDDDSQELTNTVTMDEPNKTVTAVFEQIEDEPTHHIINTDAAVKAGKNRLAPKDSLTITGNLSLDGAIAGPNDVDLRAADHIEVYVFAENDDLDLDVPDPIEEDNIPIDTDDIKNGKFTYKRPNDSTIEVTSLVLDFNDNSFNLQAKKSDLSGLSAPIVLQILFGDYFGEAVIEPADINGGAKPVPLILLSGMADAIAATKAPKVTATSFSLNGGIVTDDTEPVDLSSETVVITWGPDVAVPEQPTKKTWSIDGFSEKGAGKWVSKTTIGQVKASVTIDLTKGAFKVSIKKDTDVPLEGPFDMSWTDFDPDPILVP